MASPSSSAAWLRVRPDNIPAELRAQPFVLWRAEPRGEDKPAKVPHRVNAPQRRASSTDPTTWASFDAAAAAYSDLVDQPADPLWGPVAGIGVVLTAEAEITCLDLDRVIDADGGLDGRAAVLVARLASWTELSPSGTGLHIFVRGRVERALKGAGLEVYARDRYIALTGHRWPGTPDRLVGQQLYLDHLVAATTEPERRPWTGPSLPPPDDLAGSLRDRLEGWGVPTAPMRRWSDGYLVELPECPWASSHTTGAGGAAVMIRASGAFDFTCLHAHCADRGWRDYRALMERR